MTAQVKKLVVAVAAAVTISTGSAAEVTDAEQIKIDLGIEKITVEKPRDCADGAVESCITVKTEEDSLLMKICERTPESEKFLDVESQIPSNALTAVVLNNDLAWTKGLNDNLRKFAPELADLLSVLSNVVDGVTGGVAVADVPDAEDDDGVGKMFVLGVEGQETWTALTNALTLVGEINAGTAIGGSPIKRVSLTSGGRLSVLLSARSPLLIYMPSTNDCDRVFGFSSQSVFNEWNRMIRGGSSLVHEEAFKACAGDLLQHADRGFCYVATNALKAAGTGVLKAVGLSPDVFDVPGEFWFFSTIVADKDANAVRIRMRMPKGASGTVEAAGRLALRFFENLHPELAGLVTFVEGYSPSAEAKERLGQISGALLSLRDQLGVEGLDFTTERPQQDAAKSDVRFSAERCALLARLLANGTSGHGVAENYLPATAVAAWGFQPDAETAIELLYAISTRLGVTNVAQVIRSSFLNRGENFASDVAFAVTLGDAEHKHADGISHKGINFIAAQKLLNKEIWSLIQDALEESGAVVEVKEDTGIVICHLPVSDATKELLPYVDPAICFVPNGDDSVILFSTSHETGTAAMAAGRDGTNRLVRSEMFLEQMGGEFPSHQTFRYVAPKADEGLVLSLGEILNGLVPESVINMLLSFDVSAVWSTGVGNMELTDARLLPGETIYVHKGRTSPALYETGKRVLDAAIDALAESVSVAYPYDYAKAHRFDSPLVSLSVGKADANGTCVVRMVRRAVVAGAPDLVIDGTIAMPADRSQVTRHTIAGQGLEVKLILSSECVFGFDATEDGDGSHSFILREPRYPAGMADDPWQVGRTADDKVVACTNSAGMLFVEGTGNVCDFHALSGGLLFGETTDEAEFGAGVTGIGSNMLATCGGLTRIRLYAENPPTLGENALPPPEQLEAILVPAGFRETYRNAWPEYGDVIVDAVLGSEDMPWRICADMCDTVAAYTNGTGRLFIVGEGAMSDFSGSAPWAGADVTECLVAAGVTEIGRGAFADCPRLGTLVLYAETPPALGLADVSDAKIFVAAGAANAYRKAWPERAAQIDEMRSVKGETIATHLYEMIYKWWDATNANDVAESLAVLAKSPDRTEKPGECSFTNRSVCTSCRNGNFFGRNFDCNYGNADECVMHVPAAEGRLESVGVASWFFPKEMQDALAVDEFLPELTVDGINEKGVAINVNTVPGGDNGWTEGTNPGGRRLCAAFAVRAVLDGATNAAHAVEILESRDIYSIRPLEFHWMISDLDESYVVECVSNRLVVLKAHDARPKMTDFYVSHSPNVTEYDVVSDNEELTSDEHTPHAMGIECYERVADGLDKVNSVETMFAQMTNVWCVAATNDIVHAVHTSVYDLEKHELTICMQEDVGTTRLRYRNSPYAPVSVTPGKPVSYVSPAEAFRAKDRAVFTLSDKVANVFGDDEAAKAAYCAKFDFTVTMASDWNLAVVAELRPEAWTNTVVSAQEATRQIPVADIAALESGETMSVSLTNCMPGFFYSLYDAWRVMDIGPDKNRKNLNVLCGMDGKVEIPFVKKPHATAGFFMIGVRSADDVKPPLSGAPDDTSVLFSTVGPDKYADGTQVMDGECYALVWSAGEFAGIKADCTCVDPEDKVIAIFPSAKDGKCKLSKYTLTEDKLDKGGNVTLWLLDTRVYKSNADGSTMVSLAKQESVTKVSVVNGAVAVEAAVEVAKAGFGGIAGSDLVVAGAAPVPADTPAPRVKSFKVGDVYVETEVENTVPYLTYGVSAGKELGELAKDPAAAATGKAGETITIYIKKTADHAVIYSGITI